MELAIPFDGMTNIALAQCLTFEIFQMSFPRVSLIIACFYTFKTFVLYHTNFISRAYLMRPGLVIELCHLYSLYFLYSGTSLQRTCCIADTSLQRTPFLETNGKSSIEIYLFITDTSLQLTPFSRANGVRYREVPLSNVFNSAIRVPECINAKDESLVKRANNNNNNNNVCDILVGK